MGAYVTDAMGRQAPEGLLGIHLNVLTAAVALKDQLPAQSEQERAAHDALTTFLTDGFGIVLEQSTRPQTIGYSLLDSPVGLAAWMLDHDTDSYYKISRAFVDGEPAGNLTRDTHRRQHHAVLADGHRRLGRPVVLGVRTGPGRSRCGRPGSAAGRGSGRLHERSPARSSLPRAAGSRWSSPASPTSTSPTGAATSPPGRSRELFSTEVRAAFRSLR